MAPNAVEASDRGGRLRAAKGRAAEFQEFKTLCYLVETGAGKTGSTRNSRMFAAMRKLTEGKTYE